MPSATFIRDHTHYTLQRDGRYTTDKDLEWRLNNQQAVEQMGQIPLQFSSLQSLDVLEAYTLTPKGQKVYAHSDGIREQLFPASQGATMFDDRRIKTVVFPSLSVGAHLVMRVRITAKEAVFPGHFFEFAGALPPFDRQSFEVSLQAPADIKVKLSANKMEGGEEKSNDPTLRRWRWYQTNIPARAPEMGAASAHGVIPHVALTTFESDAQIAQAYWNRAQDKVKVTPNVQKLADKVTRGIADRRGQAEALYRWVSQNVRYVAIHLGFGSVVPHSADEVLQAGYGDCKDKSTLLSALLSAKGIASQAALVNIGNVYWIPPLAMPTTVFNHLITYLPEWDLFVDPTPGKAEFAVLSSTLAGKKTLVLGEGDRATDLKSLPLGQPEKDFVVIQTEMTLSTDGKITGRSEIRSGGTLDLMARTMISSIPSGAEPQVASQMMGMSGQQGSGTLQHFGAEDTSRPFKYSTRFSLPDMVQLPGPGAMMVPVGFPGLVQLASIFRPLALTERDSPLIFGSGRITEHITLNLPDGMTLQKLPTPTLWSNSLSRYESNIMQKGQVLHIDRQLDVRLPGPTVHGEAYQLLRQTATQVIRDLKSALIY